MTNNNTTLSTEDTGQTTTQHWAQKTHDKQQHNTEHRRNRTNNTGHRRHRTNNNEHRRHRTNNNTTLSTEDTRQTTQR
jgi:hypothetical protein